MGSVSVVTTVKWFWFLFSIAALAGVIVALARSFKEASMLRYPEVSLKHARTCVLPADVVRCVSICAHHCLYPRPQTACAQRATTYSSPAACDTKCPLEMVQKAGRSILVLSTEYLRSLCALNCPNFVSHRDSALNIILCPPPSLPPNPPLLVHNRVQVAELYGKAAWLIILVSSCI